MKRGRPLMLGSLDKKVTKLSYDFKKASRSCKPCYCHRCCTSTDREKCRRAFKMYRLILSLWTQSLFRRMGFGRRMCTTKKPEIPYRALMEAKLFFQHQIASLVEEHHIPPSLIMNFDQTPLKYTPVSNSTLAKKGSKHVPITCGAFKESVTATFNITYSNKFLPMQLIYKGKTRRSFPRVNFQQSFSLSANMKHFSNTQESMKLLDEIILPFVEKERDMLNLGEKQPAFLIIDVFSGQMAKSVIDKMAES